MRHHRGPFLLDQQGGPVPLDHARLREALALIGIRLSHVLPRDPPRGEGLVIHGVWVGGPRRHPTLPHGTPLSTAVVLPALPVSANADLTRIVLGRFSAVVTHKLDAAS